MEIFVFLENGASRSLEWAKNGHQELFLLMLFKGSILDRFFIRFWAPKSAQEQPKSGPRAAKSGQRAAKSDKERAKSGQERPKSSQESRKSGQKRPKSAPRE